MSGHGGMDLTAEDFDEAARLSATASECFKRLAEALRNQGRNSTDYQMAALALEKVNEEMQRVVIATAGRN